MIALLVLIPLTTPACVTKVVQKPEPELRLAVDTHDPILQLPVYVAVRERLFASERLRISLSEYPSPNEATAALTNGACQLASAGFEQVLLASAQGTSLTAFALLSRSPMLSLVANVRSRRRHQSASDLKGESIAVVSAGDATDLFARYAVEQDGLDPSQIETVPEGSLAAAAAAFERRDTAGAVVDAARLHGLETRGAPYVLLADTRTLSGLLQAYGVSTYPASCLYASTAWTAENKDRARRLVKALLAAGDFIRKHTAEDLAPMLPQEYRKTVDAAALASAINQARPLFSRDATFTADAAGTVRKVLAGSIPSFRKSTVPPAAYTNEFIASSGK